VNISSGARVLGCFGRISILDLLGLSSSSGCGFLAQVRVGHSRPVFTILATAAEFEADRVRAENWAVAGWWPRRAPDTPRAAGNSVGHLVRPPGDLRVRA
jgi:hypothetical protein